MRAAIALGLLAVAVTAAAWWWLFADDGAEDAAVAAVEDFARAWLVGDWEGVDAATAADDAAGEAHRQQAEALAVDARELEVVDLDLEAVDEGTATASYTVSHELAGVGPWSYDGVIEAVEVDPDEPRWAVDWRPATLHPELAEGQVFDLATVWPERAEIVDRDGEALAGEGDVVVVGVEPQRVEDPEATAEAIDELTPADGAQAAELLDRDDLEEDWFYPLVTMPRPAYEAVREELRPVPGLVFQEGTDRAPVDDAVAGLVGETGEITAEQLEAWGEPYAEGDIVGRSGLEAALERELAGEPSVELRLVEDGEVVDVLRTWEGEAPEDVVVTLDRDAQGAARGALDAADPEAAAVVVVDVDDGGILAAASHPVGGFPRAVAGQYAPGSTFKVVTAAALLDAGVAPDDPLDCPGEFVAAGRAFRNAGDRDLGTVSLTEAFAESCNTAFIAAALDAGEGALAEAAATFGFVEDGAFDVAGLTSAAAYASPVDDAELAAAAIGQGRVLASPAQMAAVAAGAVGGAYRRPHLLAGVEVAEAPLGEAAAEDLPELMAAVVVEGTGEAAAVDGVEVVGKTGTAEAGGGVEHAWFIGAADGLAFAVLVEDGGAGGETAAPIAADLVGRLR